MSLIINVLKELENRENDGQAAIPSMLIQANDKPTIPALRLTLAISLGVFFVMLIAYFTSLSHRPITPKQHTLAVATEHRLHPLLARENEKNWLSPVTISGVSLAVKDNITELTFSLNHPALYRLETYTYNNSMALIFDNATFNSTLPTFDTLKTAFSQLNSRTEGNQTRFSFTLQPTASIKNINLVNEANDPQLIMTLDNGEHAINATAIKTPAMQSLVNQAYDAATALIQAGNKSAAKNELRSILETDPTHDRARIALAAILLSENKLASANDLINEGLVRSPDSLPLTELKARMLSDAGNTTLAIELLQNHLPPLAESPSTYALLAVLYDKNNEAMKAAAIYRDLTSMNSHEGSWWLGLAIALDKLGKTNSALLAYEKASHEGNIPVNSLSYLNERLHQLEGADHDNA